MTYEEPDTEPRVREKKINVPMQYRNGAKFLKAYLEDGKSLSNAIENNHCKISSMYSLLSKIRANKHILDQVIETTSIFQKEPRLNPWMGKFLIGELLFGRGQLSGNSKPVTCVLSYEDQLRDALTGVDGEISTEKFEYKIPRYIRINTLKIKRSEVHEYLHNEGWCLVPREADETYDTFLEKIRQLEDDHYLIDFHVDDILIFPSSSRRVWAHNELVRDWQLILQDKASCLPPFLLNPPKGAQVLDMCAAPGMKTTYLAALMKNKGKVYAIERDVKRYKELCGIVEHSDGRIVQPINEDAFNIDHERCPVEYILLDPSCSGSGMLTRDGKEQFDRDRVYKLAGLQYKLLKHAMVAFPEVKRIVYSTCSRYPEENEDVVHGIIKTTPNFKLLNGAELLGNKWHSFGSEQFGEIGRRCLYARTKDDMTCTFFVAVFERCGEGEVNKFYEAKRFSGGHKQQVQQQPGESRNEKRKKKWQQAKLEALGGGNAMDVDVEPSTKPKKSKKHSVDEEVENNEESATPRKSKKSKKSSVSEEMDNGDGEINLEIRTKSKKHLDESQEIGEESPKKSKKKTRKSAEIPEDEKPEKKSKKKRLEEPIEVETVENQPKKEKKSKKKKHIDDDVADLKEAFAEIEVEAKHKKSKKSKKDKN